MKSSSEAFSQVSTAYQKAHKTYVLSSALLASWELIGITLDTQTKWGITLKSPNAIPLILTSLMVYFGYKTTIEWYQCVEARNTNRPAQIDFRVTHFIAGGSLAVVLVQSIIHRQIVDVVMKQFFPFEQHVLGVFVILTFIWGYALRARIYYEARNRGMVVTLACGISASFVVFALTLEKHTWDTFLGTWDRFLGTVLNILICGLIAAPLGFVWRRYMKFETVQQERASKSQAKATSD